MILIPMHNVLSPDQSGIRDVGMDDVLAILLVNCFSFTSQCAGCIRKLSLGGGATCMYEHEPFVINI